ncbi:hypothetical protein [Butyricicoccus faecihominis]|uniref:hypothetical protein n=1 Tax=Butyricicoccus faecihominis TaxID=1712515 RepID=UPI00247B0328|nr:hypothetical protein [Butyricicoccus faecihominis]
MQQPFSRALTGGFEKSKPPFLLLKVERVTVYLREATAAKGDCRRAYFIYSLLL